MTDPHGPDFPHPFPPVRPPEFPVPAPLPGPQPPPRTTPVVVPIVDVPAEEAGRRLLDRRTVLVSGPLDHQAVDALVATLMALDGQSDRDVEMFLNSEGGPIGVVSAALDVVQLMRARVNVTCMGTARGTAAVLLACGTGERRAAPNALVSLRCDSSVVLHGRAGEVERGAQELTVARRRLQEAVSSATGLPHDLVADELERGPIYDALRAKELGLVDVVLDPQKRR